MMVMTTIRTSGSWRLDLLGVLPWIPFLLLSLLFGIFDVFLNDNESIGVEQRVLVFPFAGNLQIALDTSNAIIVISRLTGFFLFAHRSLCALNTIGYSNLDDATYVVTRFALIQREPIVQELVSLLPLLVGELNSYDTEKLIGKDCVLRERKNTLSTIYAIFLR
jgi:hypothetical protein